MLELADRQVSGTCARMSVGVRVSLWAHGTLKQFCRGGGIWYTRTLEVRMAERLCRFKSCPRHKQKMGE